jgi:hypothetical protein
VCRTLDGKKETLQKQGIVFPMEKGMKIANWGDGKIILKCIFERFDGGGGMD